MAICDKYRAKFVKNMSTKKLLSTDVAQHHYKASDASLLYLMTYDFSLIRKQLLSLLSISCNARCSDCPRPIVPYTA